VAVARRPPQRGAPQARGGVAAAAGGHAHKKEHEQRRCPTRRRRHRWQRRASQTRSRAPRPAPGRPPSRQARGARRWARRLPTAAYSTHPARRPANPPRCPLWPQAGTVAKRVQDARQSRRRRLAGSPTVLQRATCKSRHSGESSTQFFTSRHARSQLAPKLYSSVVLFVQTRPSAQTLHPRGAPDQLLQGGGRDTAIARRGARPCPSPSVCLSARGVAAAAVPAPLRRPPQLPLSMAAAA